MAILQATLEHRGRRGMSEGFLHERLGSAGGGFITTAICTGYEITTRWICTGNVSSTSRKPSSKEEVPLTRKVTLTTVS